MNTNTPGWAIELKGDEIDLNDCREQLIRPYDPWVEDYQSTDGPILLLRSSTWANIIEAADVLRDATRIIERLNGAALLIHSDAKPLKLGQVMRFRDDGKRDHIILPVTAHFKLQLGRMRARGTITTGNRTESPQESPLQKLLRDAESDDNRAELLAHLSRADNWYDLYKSMELARRLAGGQKALETVLGTDWNEWERAWRTANCYRHAPDPSKYPLPNPPAQWEDARNLILRTIPRVL